MCQWLKQYISGSIYPLWSLLSFSVESNSVIIHGWSYPGSKRERNGLVHLQPLLGHSWVSYYTARLLKPINGMAQSTPVYHCSVLHYSSHLQPIQWKDPFFHLEWFEAKFWGRVGDFLLFWFVPSADVYKLHSTQLRDNQTGTSNRQLVTMAKFLQKESH